MSRFNPEFISLGQDYVSPSVNLLVSSIQKVYLNLVDIANYFIYSISITMPLEWKYERDMETGLEILKAKKHPKSLDVAQELADEIFK